MRAALLLAGLALVLGGAPAAAHAALLSSVPAEDTVLREPVRTVEVRFTEPVLRDYTSVAVRDATGWSVVTGPVQFDAGAQDTVRVPVRILVDGAYSVEWRALTADGHTADGTYAFQLGGAGDALALAQVRGAEAPLPAALEAVARAALYLGLLAATGAALFAFAVERSPRPPRRLLAASALFAAVGAFGGLAGLLLVGLRAGVSPFGNLGSASLLGLARVALLYGAALALVAALWMPARARILAALALALGAAAMVATALGSHAATDTGLRPLSIVLDLAHLAVGAVWVGGVFAFVVLGRREPEATATAIARFTPFALASVGVLVLTGAWAALQRVPQVARLDVLGALGQPYAQTLALKVLLVVPLLALGWHHKERVLPALRAGSLKAEGFHRTLAAEALLMVGVLVASGMLATSTPADLAAPTLAQEPPPFFEREATTWTTHVALRVWPNPVVVGPQRLSLAMHPITIFDIPDETRVRVQLALDGSAVPGPTLNLTRVSGFEWTAGEGAFFTQPGMWTVVTQLERPDEHRTIHFRVRVGPAPLAG